MRTKRQRFYDRMYRTVEFDIFNLFDRVRTMRSLKGTKFGKDFWDYYRHKVLPYWKKFGVRPSPLWFKYYYRVTGNPDPRYIPDNIFHKYVVPFFDNPMYERQMEDKNLYTLLFPDLKQPEALFKHFATTDYSQGGTDIYCDNRYYPISREEALRRCVNGGRMIIKPTRDTGGGSDVKVFHADIGAEEISKMLDSYAHVDYIVQRTIVQHPALAEFNASSVNSLRIITVVFHGEVHILSAILRIGHAGSDVDNYSLGGYAAVIDPDGTLQKKAITHSTKEGKTVFTEQTENGRRFEGFRIPEWEKVCRTVKDAALRLPHHKLVGWDFAIDENGDVVLIEFNCHIGQNQSTCGPTFGDLTDEIFGEIFRRKKK